MALVALLLLQTASTASVAPDDRLLHLVPPARCKQTASEITVCGKSVDTYRLPKAGPSDEAEATLLPKAEWRLFGDTKMGVGLSQRSVGGFSAPAAMATIKIPF